MKNRFLLLAFCAFAFSIIACKKAENTDYFEGGMAPVLSASAATVSLESGQEANTALVLNWTNPNYMFTSGVSSQDVTYTIEMDTLGANFGSSKKVSTVVSKDLMKTYTVGELNAILGNDMLLQLAPRRNYTIQLRVTSSIGSAVKITSNVVSVITKPFAPPPKVEPPASGTLYITGDATPGNWQCACGEPELTSQKFNKMSSTLYVLPSIPLIGGKSYTFVPVYGSWNVKYSIKTKNDPNEVNGGDFQVGGEDILAPATSGNYKIEVNFQTGKFTVTKQ